MGCELKTKKRKMITNMNFQNQSYKHTKFTQHHLFIVYYHYFK